MGNKESSTKCQNKSESVKESWRYIGRVGNMCDVTNLRICEILGFVEVRFLFAKTQIIFCASRLSHNMACFSIYGA